MDAGEIISLVALILQFIVFAGGLAFAWVKLSEKASLQGHEIEELKTRIKKLEEELETKESLIQEYERLFNDPRCQLCLKRKRSVLV